MRLTTKGRYAVTAMIDLAMNQSVGPVSLKNISDNQGISLSYLEQLFAKMKRSELVVGARGPGGGYVLAREIHSISIADIILAVDEPLDITECEGQENCHNGQRCLAHDLWSDLSEQLHGFLAGIHLGELMERSGIQLAANGAPMTRLSKQSGQRVGLPE
jgi:Rrf2 family iron-sulfur cluster assembly transcriptional regulator